MSHWGFFFATAGNIICACGEFGSGTVEAKAVSKELYQQVAHAQLTSKQDNDKLEIKMKDIAAAFARQCKAYGSYPHTPRQTAMIEGSLSKFAGENPFADFPYRIAADDENFAAAHDTTRGDRHRIAVLVKYDSTLNETQIQYWRQNPPPDWVEMPGTIVILHDGSTSFAVWGAGADGKPIKNETAKDYTVISGSRIAKRTY